MYCSGPFPLTTNEARTLVNISHPVIAKCLHVPVASIAADVPLVFPTVQLYVPKMSVILWAMLSTVLYVPAVVLVTTCVCWYVELIVITAPSFLQVTVVAGPPVEVQVRVLVVSLYTNVVTVGTPEKSWGGFFSSDKFADITQYIYTCNNICLQRRGHKWGSVRRNGSWEYDMCIRCSQREFRKVMEWKGQQLDTI